jgi:glycosyltransferase involved in cell wall biosynthesis
MEFSIIIPVYNRPDEVDELLDSLTKQRFSDFEVLIVEDGSVNDCRAVVQRYAERMNLHYFAKSNSGPGPSRNYGAERAKGDYLLILDSDCVLPGDYLQVIHDALQQTPLDAFGGPDRAHDSFTPIQKAINYAMTSFFTTGGIRGGKRKMDKFYPRSFNMGVRRTVYEALHGFSEMRFGEDIDFSIRIFKGGYRCSLIPEAWVWHKRRTDLKKFFKQVYNSGIARIHLYKKYPESLKLVHLLPACFTVGVGVLLCLSCWKVWFLLPLLAFALLIGVDATVQTKSAKVGLLAILASYVQLLGYGSGFLAAWWQRCVRHRQAFSAFNKNFYQ